MLAAEEMGHKGVRVMTPLESSLANALRTKLGKGRDLPEEPKPKRPPRAKKAPAAEGEDGAKKPAARVRKAKAPGEALEETPVELKPAATIVKPKPSDAVMEPVAAAPVAPAPAPIK